jgi:hypothetical protein
MRHGQRYVARLGKVLEFARIFLPSNEALKIAAAVHNSSCNVFDWNQTRANIFKHNGDRLLMHGQESIHHCGQAREVKETPKE